MASTASDGLPCYPAAPPVSALLDDHHHQLYCDPAAAASSSFPATEAQEPQPPPPAAVAEPRKPRKRARASRRAPTTVLNTDASNFRAMVQEFTGFPAPQFAPHLGPGALFRAGPSSAAVSGAPFHHQLLRRPSPLKLTATPHRPPPSCNTNTSSFTHTLFANSGENPTAAAAPSLSSQLYSRFGPTFAAGAVPSYGEGFAAAMEGERAEHGHGLATSLLHGGDDRYHDH